MQFHRNNFFFGNYIQTYGCSFKLSPLGFGSNAIATAKVSVNGFQMS